MMEAHIRQALDDEYATALQRMRAGSAGPEDVAALAMAQSGHSFVTREELRQTEVELAQTFSHFASELERRVASVEASVALLSRQMGSDNSLQSAFRGVVLAMPTPATGSAPRGPATPYLGSDSPVAALPIAPRRAQPDRSQWPTLESRGMETKWFTKRPMPDFEVVLVGPDGETVTETAGRYVCVKLLTGHGLYDDEGELLKGPPGAPADTALQFPLNAGTAIISGLRFQAVSSKNGKVFQLEFTAPGLRTAPSRSPDVTVLSERLKNERKAAEMADLRPSDCVSRVPGLGKSYCQRLNQLGFHTVNDLATIPVSPAERSKRLSLLGKLRKDRGALTEAKLMQLVREAHQVVRAAEREEREEREEQEAAARAAAAPAPAAASESVSACESEAELTERKLNSPLWGDGLLQDLPTDQISGMLNYASVDGGADGSG